MNVWHVSGGLVLTWCFLMFCLLYLSFHFFEDFLFIVWDIVISYSASNVSIWALNCNRSTPLPASYPDLYPPVTHFVLSDHYERTGSSVIPPPSHFFIKPSNFLWCCSGNHLLKILFILFLLLSTCHVLIEQALWLGRSCQLKLVRLIHCFIIISFSSFSVSLMLPVHLH